jgi:NitT/TauT family transport system ATP-binding protein
MNAKVLQVENLAFSYGERLVLDGINFNLQHGEFLAVVGMSGCGKSTLLQLLAADRKPTQGTIQRSGTFRRVHQQDGLFPWLTCEENILLGLRGAPAEAKSGFSELVETLNVVDHLKSFPHELSGGLRQRVELARALIGHPEGLLLDEPFSSLDYLTRMETREYLARILKKRPTTVVMVTHDIPEALFFADRLLLLAGKPASIKKTINNPERNQTLAENIWKELR